MRVQSFGLLVALAALPLVGAPGAASAQATQPTSAPTTQPASEPASEPASTAPGAAAGAANASGETQASAVPEGYDVLLHVEGMVCQFCASGIERLMNREERVAGFEVDFDGGIVVVSIVEGETVSDEDFARIIRRAGYSMAGLERAE